MLIGSSFVLPVSSQLAEDKIKLSLPSKLLVIKFEIVILHNLHKGPEGAESKFR